MQFTNASYRSWICSVYK